MSGRPSTVADLRAALDAAIASAIPEGEPVALLDFPSYPNVGDSAIWLGTVAVLRGLGCPVVYVADQLSYSRRALERRLPAGAAVLLQGGGSFGDLWPEHQLFRERVVQELPERPIVQLPVSIDFRTPAAEDRARTTLDRHERLTLLCRDRESLAYAEAHYRAPSRLCPDAAFGLDPAPRDGRPPTWSCCGVPTTKASEASPTCRGLACSTGPVPPASRATARGGSASDSRRGP